MRVLITDDVEAFRLRAEPLLLAHEAENNLLFGIMRSVALGRYEDPLLACVEDESGDILAVAIRTPPHNLVLSAAAAETTRALAEMIDGPFPGVQAEAKQALVFAEAWTARSGGSFHLQMDQTIYALSRLRAPAGVPGRARVATDDDRELLLEWTEDFEREALPRDGTHTGQASRRVTWFLEDPEAGVIFWEHNGEPVSMAGNSGPTPNGMRIGPVYTPPRFRGRGYATAAVAETSARLLAAGRRFCFLYADRANATSNGVYLRLGYEPVCDAAVYRFG